MSNFLSYKNILLVSIALLSNAVVFAQVRSDIDVQKWEKGKVTLTTGEMVEGAICYYRSQDIITVHQADSSMSSYSPVNVQWFEVTDVASNRNHLFKTVYWDQGKEYTDFKKPVFFEEIMKGNATLLLRETYERHGTDPYLVEAMQGIVYDPLGYPINAEYADQIKPSFFVMTPDGDVVALQKVRKDFLDYCGKKAGRVKSYARQQKLRFDQPNEFISIVNYYNTL